MTRNAETLRITRLPAFSDNYLWLIDNGRLAAVVDPGDAQPVLKALHSLELELDTILLTHHHPDHTGGVDTLAASTSANVIGPHSARIPQVQRPVGSGDVVELLGVSLQVLEIPGHTLDHIAYFLPACPATEHKPLLFCGDTLFAGGCGRVFEGSMEQMHRSLVTLSHLPADTQVHCAHEYTQSNLHFAQAVEPDNPDLQARCVAVQQLRAQQRATVPSRLCEELATNPFLRCQIDTVIASAEHHSGNKLATDAAVFAALREWKDSF